MNKLLGVISRSFPISILTKQKVTQLIPKILSCILFTIFLFTVFTKITNAEPCNPVTGKNCYYCYMNPADPDLECDAWEDYYPPGSGMGPVYRCDPQHEKDDVYCSGFDLDEDACNDPGNLLRTCVSTGVPIDCEDPNHCVWTSFCPVDQIVDGDCGKNYSCCAQGACAYCDSFGGPPTCREIPDTSPFCEYDSLSDCDASGECVPGGLFGYNCVNNSCELAPIGESDYVSEGACILDGCERHSCVNKNCVPDPDGNFDTLNLCALSGCQSNRSCVGKYSNLPGTCQFMFCYPSDDYFPDGWNPQNPAPSCGSITCSIDESNECTPDPDLGGCINEGYYDEDWCENDLDCLAEDGGPLIQPCICPLESAPACDNDAKKNFLNVCCIPIPSTTKVDRPTLLSKCAGGAKGIETAIGCIPVENMTDFVGFMVKFGIGVGGGVAFLLIIFSALQMITSGGNPERVKGAKELLTASVAGLLLIIFSVFLLELIGIRILQLPGF